MIRVRLVSVVVEPQVVIDDGDTLTPVSVEQMVVSPGDWSNIVEIMDKAVAELSARLNTDVE